MPCRGATRRRTSWHWPDGTDGLGRKRSGRDVRGIHRSSGGGRGCSISIVRRSRGADRAASTENFIRERQPRNPEFSSQAGDDNCPLSDGRFLRRGPRAFARITRAIAGRGDRANPRYNVTIGSRDPSAEPEAVRGDTARHAAGALHGQQLPSGEEDRGKNIPWPWAWRRSWCRRRPRGWSARRGRP